MDQRGKPRRKKDRWRAPKRDAIIFAVGIVGIIVLTVDAVWTGDTPEATLIALFGAMIGLPAFLHVDEDRDPQPQEQGG